ncbi:MAG TPA: hypothetical protein PKY94_03125, partial [Smithellaceae bacterium]|nr:hypothetical protein [Smithellaceae bacterium]
TILSVAPAAPADRIRNKNTATSLLIFLIFRLPATHCLVGNGLKPFPTFNHPPVAIPYSTASKNATAISN